MHQKQRGHNNGKYCSSHKVLRMATGILGMCVIGYIAGPPLYWHSVELLAALGRRHSSSSSCPPCLCDCSTYPFLTLPEGLNFSFAECMRQDEETSRSEEGAEKLVEYKELVADELRQKEAETLERQRVGDIALLEAKKAASQYQKEADKCNSGMETCEDAREKAEATLEAQRKITAMWELRARQKGWKQILPNTSRRMPRILIRPD
ncbi:hypothetical protein Dimus_032987 [Dionaea muscipula]